MRKLVSLSGLTQLTLALHLEVVQTMFRLFKNGLSTIALSDLELVAIVAIVADCSCPGHIGQGEDVRYSCLTEPHISISREGSS